MVAGNKRICSILIAVLFCMIASGCSIIIQIGRKSDIDKIKSLNYEINALNAKLDNLQSEKEDEIGELEAAKRLLEKKLKSEIGDKEVRLEMAEKGLAIIFLAEVLFDSGKSDIKEQAYPVLDKIAKVLSVDIGGRNIGVEGHTDNEPIKYSSWKSNWELSTARATSVLHYLVDTKGIEPKRVSATGYGEYRPVVENDTVENRRQNRRVEIVVLPKNIEKIEADIEKITKEKRRIEKQLNKYKK